MSARERDRKAATLGVEGRADPGHLAAAHALDAQGPDEVVDPARGDTGHVRLLDDREQGPLRPPARFEQAREVRAVAHARDSEVDRAHPGVPAPLAVPVAMREAALRVTLALGQPGELADLGLHDRLGQEPDALAQDVDLAIGAHLAQGLEQGHAVVGHRGVLRVVGCYSNDARMTRWPLPCPARSAVTPTVGTRPGGQQTSLESRSDAVRGATGRGVRPMCCILRNGHRRHRFRCRGWTATTPFMRDPAPVRRRHQTTRRDPRRAPPA